MPCPACAVCVACAPWVVQIFSHGNRKSISFGVIGLRSQEHSDMLASSDRDEALWGAFLGRADLGIIESSSCWRVACGLSGDPAD